MSYDPQDVTTKRRRSPEQPGLFDPKPRTVANAQAAQLKRVSGAISTIVLAFCRARLGECFHMDDLTSFVQKTHACAPDSARRVLSDLRNSGAVSVELVSRAGSLYKVERVA